MVCLFLSFNSTFCLTKMRIRSNKLSRAYDHGRTQSRGGPRGRHFSKMVRFSFTSKFCSNDLFRLKLIPSPNFLITFFSDFGLSFTTKCVNFFQSFVFFTKFFIFTQFRAHPRASVTEPDPGQCTP